MGGARVHPSRHPPKPLIVPLTCAEEELHQNRKQKNEYFGHETENIEITPDLCFLGTSYTTVNYVAHYCSNIKVQGLLHLYYLQHLNCRLYLMW